MIFLARRRASAIVQLWICVWVSVSVTSRSSIETDERARRAEPVFAQRLHSTCPTLCYKEIRVAYLQK